VKTLTITCFNISSNTRIGSLPKLLVSPWRTIEDMLALFLTGTAYHHLNLLDFGARGKTSTRLEADLRTIGPVRRIFCPLGVGSHPDHTAVRDFAISFWNDCGRKPQLWFYEDLPYAALARELDNEVLVKRISSLCGKLNEIRIPMTEAQFKRKMLICGAYVSQRDIRQILRKHAKHVGRVIRAPYAEKLYFCTKDSII